MSSTPQLPTTPSSTAAASAAFQLSTAGRWMHELRNELNTAMMAAAAARRLVQDGDAGEALENIRRTEAACYRCAQLLQRDPNDQS
jgi:hypothetical protein